MRAIAIVEVAILVVASLAGTAHRRSPNARRASTPEIGHTLGEGGATGGGTDAAYPALTNGAVVESLGLPGFGAHANTEEYVLVDRIPGGCIWRRG